MAITYHMMFSNPHIEERFRRVVTRAEDQNREIGGYLITHSWEPLSCPVRVKQSRFCAPGEYLYFIESVILVPNEVKKREQSTKWMCWDVDKVRQIAEESADAIGGRAWDFHSHPGRDLGLPSDNDLLFAANWCSHEAGYGQRVMHFCIVTGRPLRIVPYRMVYDASYNRPRTMLRTSGQFFSWRRKELRELLKA